MEPGPFAFQAATTSSLMKHIHVHGFAQKGGIPPTAAEKIDPFKAHLCAR
jgi:hypothetical protein